MIPSLPTPFGVPLDVLSAYLKSLYDADWNDPRGAIRFSDCARLNELAKAVFFHNTRTYLNALLAEGGTAATATGCLNRVFVGRMFDELRLVPEYREMLRRHCKVMSEMDLWPLHKVRLVAEYGKLTAQRNKRLTVTKLGRELLADARAGELFRRLFLTYFRTMDMCYLAHVREMPEVQASLAIILWRLEQVAENWRAVKGMAEQIFPPRLTAHIVGQQHGDFDNPDFFATTYVLTPLKDFGLIERQRESEWGVEGTDVVRVTPLFRRLIGFAEFPVAWNN